MLNSTQIKLIASCFLLNFVAFQGYAQNAESPAGSAIVTPLVNAEAAGTTGNILGAGRWVGNPNGVVTLDTNHIQCPAHSIPKVIASLNNIYAYQYGSDNAAMGQIALILYSPLSTPVSNWLSPSCTGGCLRNQQGAAISLEQSYYNDVPIWNANVKAYTIGVFMIEGDTTGDAGGNLSATWQLTCLPDPSAQASNGLYSYTATTSGVTGPGQACSPGQSSC